MYPDIPKRDITGYLRFKRLFDLLVAFLLLILLSPLLLLIAILIKLENPKAPAVYKSTRVGRDFKTFDFLKFRSMRSDADSMVLDMKKQNEYQSTSRISPAEALRRHLESSTDSSMALFSDDGWVSERTFLLGTDIEAENNFVKINKDPRVTRIGKIIRSTSMDELPQLWNVLLGDMSLVGNRPLPPYEAELLTTDEYILRFMAPAGMTGLWQVTERGKLGITAHSRKMLDVEYAKRCSFWLDLYILLKTPFALFQNKNI